MAERRYIYKSFVGYKYITNEGYEIEIIEHHSSKNCTIRFLYNGVIRKNLKLHNIQKGAVKNFYHPSVAGVGYFGEGEYLSTLNGVKTTYYITWKHMIQRCYDPNVQKDHPSYKGCSVDGHWHNFQNYAKWYEENRIDDFEVDKDILIKGNKIYSPKNCCFVPQEINVALISAKANRGKLPIGITYHKRDKVYQAKVCRGREKPCIASFKNLSDAFEYYKFHKEKYIKKLSDKWRNKIDKFVYISLQSWQIEITD